LSEYAFLANILAERCAGLEPGRDQTDQFGEVVAAALINARVTCVLTTRKLHNGKLHGGKLIAGAIADNPALSVIIELTQRR
jgi:hypothetical protein